MYIEAIKLDCDSVCCNLYFNLNISNYVGGEDV